MLPRKPLLTCYPSPMDVACPCDPRLVTLPLVDGDAGNEVPWPLWPNLQLKCLHPQKASTRDLAIKVKYFAAAVAVQRQSVEWGDKGVGETSMWGRGVTSCPENILLTWMFLISKHQKPSSLAYSVTVWQFGVPNSSAPWQFSE